MISPVNPWGVMVLHRAWCPNEARPTGAAVEHERPDAVVLWKASGVCLGKSKRCPTCFPHFETRVFLEKHEGP